MFLLTAGTQKLDGTFARALEQISPVIDAREAQLSELQLGVAHFQAQVDVFAPPKDDHMDEKKLSGSPLALPALRHWGRKAEENGKELDRDVANVRTGRHGMLKAISTHERSIYELTRQRNLGWPAEQLHRRIWSSVRTLPSITLETAIWIVVYSALPVGLVLCYTFPANACP